MTTAIEAKPKLVIYPICAVWSKLYGRVSEELQIRQVAGDLVLPEHSHKIENPPTRSRYDFDDGCSFEFGRVIHTFVGIE